MKFNTQEKSFVTFNRDDQPEFFQLLQKRVNAYFKEKNISKYGNLSMKLKTVLMMSLYFIPLIALLSGQITSVWFMMLCWTSMGLGMSGIGLSIMHDANHGTYSRRKWVNNFLGYMIHFIGGSQGNWKIQHNVLHHSFTNIDGLDEDIDSGVIRLSPHQKRSKLHRFQIFYAPFLYGLMTVYWLFSKDFEGLVRYNNKGLLKMQGINFKRSMTHLVATKVVYIILTLIIPLIVLPFSAGIIILAFLWMHFICGMSLALIFQPAHVIEETTFFETTECGSMENHRAIHQMRTTANFANKSRLFTWLIGGLNFQIEHHLFPNICHVHYRHIAGIVKKTAQEFNVPYYQHKTFTGALRSHFLLLNRLGKGN